MYVAFQLQLLRHRITWSNVSHTNLKTIGPLFLVDLIILHPPRVVRSWKSNKSRRKINLNGKENKIMTVKMPISFPAQCMCLWPAISVVIIEKRLRDALSTWPRWQWRGFNRHRSVKGADSLWSDDNRHIGALVSRSHFILVHIQTPLGSLRLWLSRDPGPDYCDRSTHLPPLLWHHHKDTLIHAAKYTHRGICRYQWERSESMAICLQRKEQENRLTRKQQQYMFELLDGQFICLYNIL